MASSDDYNYEQILNDCEVWANEAAVLARKYFRKPTQVEFKEDESPVTVIDELIEKEIKNAISRKYPDDGIFGEESGIKRGIDENLWVIDPIDGTRSFVSGNPLFGFLLSFVKAGVPVAGVISMPILNEIYSGAVGLRATCNGKRINVSNQTSVDECVLYINEGEKLIADHPEKLILLLKAGKVRRFAYDCYPHALLAQGQIDAVIDYDLKPYDFFSLSAVIEAAGGIVSDWKGKKLDMNSAGDVVSAATPELHKALLEMLDT